MGYLACICLFLVAGILLCVSACCALVLSQPRQRLTITRTIDYRFVGFPPVSPMEMAFLAQQRAIEDSVPRYYLPPHLVACPEDYNRAGNAVAEEQFAKMVAGRQHRLH